MDVTDKSASAESSVDQISRSSSRAIRASNQLFLHIEHGIYVVLGIVLSVTALMALVLAITTLGRAVVDWSTGDALLIIIDRLLFVLMLAEILHTVRVSIGSGTLNCEPFLIVGLIASIRRVLVITLESSQAAGKQTSTEHQIAFQASMIELSRIRQLDQRMGVRFAIAIDS